MKPPEQARAVAAKERFCEICGDSLGVIENRYYDRTDTCGKRECVREMADSIAAECAEQVQAVIDDYYPGW